MTIDELREWETTRLRSSSFIVHQSSFIVSLSLAASVRYHDRAMVLDKFHPIVQRWFDNRFDQPTEPQQQGWPSIAEGRHTLIAAPTGSGKTLAAFLVCIDRLLRRSLESSPQDGESNSAGLENKTYVVYVSPLKALSNDIHRNLEQPLEEIRQLVEADGYDPPPIRTGVRTGDTPASQRQKMLRRAPHILVTTPESLYLLLTAMKSREMLRSVETVIVDEIHALARDKRGSHLALTLERLDALCEQPPVRIGLSATQRPIDDIARFLIGTERVTDDGAPDCNIVDAGHLRKLDLALEVPPSDLSAVCSHEQWDEVYERLTQLIAQHRSTLIFVNTRRLAERIAHHLTELLGEDAVTSHHGSLARPHRLEAEQRLKDGKLKAIVATASLEMGIDIGYIDLVCPIGSPRSISTFLQRIGRSGHSLGVVPKGRLFPLTRDELIECLALIRAVKKGQLDRIEIPVAPLDILAQQIVAMVSAEEWTEDALFAICRRAWPFRDLARDDFDAVVTFLSEGLTPKVRRGAYLHRDVIGGRLRPRRNARLAAITSGGAIPETAQFRVVLEPDRTLVGMLDEDFAIESTAGDVFLLGNSSWRVQFVRGGEVVVQDAQGAPPCIPFWFGEAPGRTVELSTGVSQIRHEVARRDDALRWLTAECGADVWSAKQAVDYVKTQQAALGLVPTERQIVFERFFDESGGMQLVVHAPMGARINRAWGLTLRKRFCRSFDFELQAAATDNGVLLSVGPQHSFPIESLFKMINLDNAQNLLEQALIAAPFFQTRWRWNATRALAVLRFNGGKKVPPHLQRFRSDDLLAATFPETVGCLENHEGDIQIPDHPLVRQTVHDCLHEAMDLDGWLAMLRNYYDGDIELVARDTREPSPFCQELLNANPYAFLDDAPLEERRTRALSSRRGLPIEELRDLGRLDRTAIDQVTAEAKPVIRDADELHDALYSMVAMNEADVAPWQDALEELIASGRATRVTLPPENNQGATAGPVATKQSSSEKNSSDAPLRQSVVVTAQRWPLIQAVYPEATHNPAVALPEKFQLDWQRSDAVVELVRGQMQHRGPTTASELGQGLALDADYVATALEAVEADGTVMRGHYTPRLYDSAKNGNQPEIEWCDRRLLARIHRLTLQGLRRRIRPVEPEDYVRFLIRYQRVKPRGAPFSGPVGVREVIARLEGFEMPAAAWEGSVLPARVPDYDADWLDGLFHTGELVWGRLRPPSKDRSEGPNLARLTRAMPISLALREDLPWLLSTNGNGTTVPQGATAGPVKKTLPSSAKLDDALADSPDENKGSPFLLRAGAAAVYDLLNTRGALFVSQLQKEADLLPEHLEQALRELAALGLVTSDSLVAVRGLIDRKPKGRSRRRRQRASHAAQAAGRWSCFPDGVAPTEPADAIKQWCQKLLDRWGVVFRDLLARESASPPWHQLVACYRQMERRGQLRGGRFVSGVAGEQFASTEAIQLMRTVREEEKTGQWIVVSAADPLNLLGVVTDHPRLPSSHKSALIWQDGRPIAFKRGREIVFLEEVPEARKIEMSAALQIGRRAEEKQLHVRTRARTDSGGNGSGKKRSPTRPPNPQSRLPF